MKHRLFGALALACVLLSPVVAIAADTTFSAFGNQLKRLKDNGDGTVSEMIAVAPTTNSVTSFQQTCTTSPAALTSATYTNGFVITALGANTGTAYIGGSGVTTGTGYPLVAGQSIAYGAANASQGYIICTNTTDKVAVTGN